MAVKIFFCYAHEDEALLNKLKTHLKPLQRQGLIDIWHDRDISAGMEWEHEINRRLNEAQIVLLLVSPNFMDSEYCYGVELKQALERHERKEICVIPVILDHVYWQIPPLISLQALPTDAKPLMSASWHSLNEALFDVVEGIRKVVETLLPPTSENTENCLNNVLVLTEEAKLGHLLVSSIKQNPLAMNATWISSIENVVHEAKDEFKYDTVFVDVRENWMPKKWFILMILHRFPLVPFVLIGFRKVFLSQLEEQERQYFRHYYFFDIETSPNNGPALITKLLTQSAWYLLSRGGKEYSIEKLYNINLTEYQLQAPFLQEG